MPAATTISRGASTATSSSSAWRACRPVVLGHLELAGGEVQQADAQARVRARRFLEAGHRQQEGRFAGVEIAGIGERPRRDDAHHLAADDPLGLLRVFHLLADGHPVALLDQPGDVAVGGVMGHAAHRHGRTGGVLRSRGQGQVEGARRHQRVFVEELVEVAHAEQHERERILALGLEILPHRGRHRRTECGQGRRGVGCAGQNGLGWRGRAAGARPARQTSSIVGKPQPGVELVAMYRD